jgi:hypothetical protein
LLRGGFAPIIATALIQWSGLAAMYLVVNALISLVAVCFASNRYRVEIHDQGPTERCRASERR